MHHTTSHHENLSKSIIDEQINANGWQSDEDKHVNVFTCCPFYDALLCKQSIYIYMCVCVDLLLKPL